MHILPAPRSFYLSVCQSYELISSNFGSVEIKVLDFIGSPVRNRDPGIFTEHTHNYSRLY